MHITVFIPSLVIVRFWDAAERTVSQSALYDQSHANVNEQHNTSL